MRWDALTEKDEVASREETDPNGQVAFKQVEEIFRLTAPILHVHLDGERSCVSAPCVVRTTAEHPFWVEGQGWTAAQDLRPGDRLVTLDGPPVTVSEVYATGVEEPVYNCRVADYHTYFVGQDGTFAIWAHNACGAYGRLKTMANSARNHLNMVAAYGLRKIAGGVPYRLGFAHHLSNAAHQVFHRELRAFWRPFQLAATSPTNAMYASALRRALKAAGISGQELGQLLGAAARERRAYGFLPHMPVPRVPGW